MTNPAPIDVGVLEQLRAIQRPGRPSLLERVVTIFDSESAQLLADLRAAIDAVDAESAGQAAHRLKSVCGNVGAVTMASACEAIERLARDGRIDGVSGHVEALAAEHVRVGQALRTELERND